MKRLQGEIALVTGASSGIGREIALRLAAEGASLIAVARRVDELEDLARTVRAEHGAEARVEPADLLQPDELERIAALLAEEPVDVLVNSAGFGMQGWFTRLDEARLQEMLALNVGVLTRLCRAALPGMRARGRGRVLNLGSLAGVGPIPRLAAYGASKAYVLHLSQALDEECRGTGVTVTAVAPGPVRTEFLDLAGLRDFPDYTQVMAEPGDVARKAVEGMLRGRRVVFPTWSHRLAALYVDGAPGPAQTWVVRQFMRLWGKSESSS